MMTQMGPSSNAVLRKIAAILLFLLLDYSFAFSQGNEFISDTSVIKNGWWNSLFEKHKIDFKKYNYKNTFDMGMNDTINNLWLEMGISDSLTQRDIPFRDAVIFSQGPDQTYWIITSEYARHDLDNNLLLLRNGQMACYNFISKNAIPIDTSSFQEIIVDIKKNSIRISSK
ncbi:MAG: hypothetical protein ABR927_14890 [Bacteroidales bacterium]